MSVMVCVISFAMSLINIINKSDESDSPCFTPI